MIRLICVLLLYKNEYFFWSQVKAWSNRGLSVACIKSETSKKTKDDVISGVYQLVFFTPELLIE